MILVSGEQVLTLSTFLITYMGLGTDNCHGNREPRLPWLSEVCLVECLGIVSENVKYAVLARECGMVCVKE